MHAGDAVGAPQVGYRRFYGLEKVALVELGYKVGNDLGVGFAFEMAALLFQHGTQGAVVFDDAVVHDGDFPRAVGMGMGVRLGDAAMGRPAGVANAPGPVDMGRHRCFERGDLADRFDDAQRRLAGGLSADGDARRVIAPVFESSQAFKQDIRGFSRSGVSNDATHASLLVASRTCPRHHFFPLRRSRHCI